MTISDPALPCTVCSTPSKFERSLPELDIHRCPNCDHCFSDLSRTSAREAYGEDYYAKTHRNWFEHPNVKLFETIHRVIFASKPDAAILDIGCGKGGLLEYLQRRNPRYSLIGIDLSENASPPGINLVRGDILTHEFDRQFDAVVSLAAIEHLEDVHGFVRRLRHLCVPRGQVIIMTLNDRSILYTLARSLFGLGWPGPMVRLYDKHHINHFNVSSLERLVTSDGLGIEKVLLHNAPLKAMDFPASSSLTDIVQRTGVWGTFLLGKLTGRTYLQTVVCRRV